VPGRLVVVLAFVAGWCDAGSFVGIDHIMAAHVTGNLVILAANIATGFNTSDLAKIVILPVFFVTVMGFTVLHDRVIARHRDPHRHLMELFVLEALLIAGTGVAGLVIEETGSGLDLGTALILALPVVLGMALQNAAHRLYPAIGPASTVMTGNITQFFIDLTRKMRGRPSESLINDMPSDPGQLPLLIVAFGAGCVTGALLTIWLGNGAFLIPALAVLACPVLLHRHRARC